MILHIGRVRFSPSFVPGTSKPINFTEARSKKHCSADLEGWVISAFNRFPAKRGTGNQGPKDEPQGNPDASPYSTAGFGEGFRDPLSPHQDTGPTQAPPTSSHQAPSQLGSARELEDALSRKRWRQAVPLGVGGPSPLSPLEVPAALCSSLPPRQCSRVPAVPTGPPGSIHSPTRARGFAPMGLPSCSKGLNAFKAIKQGLSKDFNAFKCNLNTYKAK